MTGDTVNSQLVAFVCLGKAIRDLIRGSCLCQLRFINSHDQVVTGVKPGSNAEKAGLRNGDVILKASSEWEAVDDENMHLVYQVRRGETELTIEFLPRGEKVPCWQYVKC